MFASVKNILQEAKNNGYAVGAFNVFNMEEAQAVVRAAVAKHTPVIVQITEKTLNYGGDGVIYDVVKAVIDRESASIPVGFHLDHGHSFDSVVRAVEVGLNSYLGETNQNPNWEELMTNPLDAKWLVEETSIDSLAVSIGNAHGFFREKADPDWTRLDEIRKVIPDTFLIIHGGSDWVNHKVAEAVKRGVACFNVDTDLRVAFNTVLCQFTRDKCNIIDPRVVMAEAREAVQKVVEKKIEMFRNP